MLIYQVDAKQVSDDAVLSTIVFDNFTAAKELVDQLNLVNGTVAVVRAVPMFKSTEHRKRAIENVTWLFDEYNGDTLALSTVAAQLRDVVDVDAHLDEPMWFIDYINAVTSRCNLPWRCVPVQRQTIKFDKCYSNERQLNIKTLHEWVTNKAAETGDTKSTILLHIIANHYRKEYASYDMGTLIDKCVNDKMQGNDDAPFASKPVLNLISFIIGMVDVKTIEAFENLDIVTAIPSRNTQ